MMVGSLFTGMLPEKVFVEERFGDPQELEMFPAEAALVACAIDRRRREFASARMCARAALARLGVAPGPILSHGDAAPAWARRAPRWPDGLVGSITHCESYRAAAVGRSCEVGGSIGIDAEPHVALRTSVQTIVASPFERQQLIDLRLGRPEIVWERVLFSAKESVYKAWFPVTGVWLDFQACTISFEPDCDIFTARLDPKCQSMLGTDFNVHGRWRVLSETGLIGTAVLISSSADDANRSWGWR
jgi:4'-phosphopantetheinyl transferase EntD